MVRIKNNLKVKRSNHGRPYPVGGPVPTVHQSQPPLPLPSFLPLSSPSFSPFPFLPLFTAIWSLLIQPKDLGERCALPAGSGAEPQPQLHFAALYACKTQLVAAFLFFCLVTVAMNSKMKASPSSGRIWNLFATCKMAAP